MKIWTNVVVAGGMLGVAVALKKLIRSRQGAGIANVDPEPLSQVAGEGIDLDRDTRAHEEYAEQGLKLPPL